VVSVSTATGDDLACSVDDSGVHAQTIKDNTINKNTRVIFIVFSLLKNSY
jgi:hypothetical protein